MIGDKFVLLVRGCAMLRCGNLLRSRGRRDTKVEAVRLPEVGPISYLKLIAEVRIGSRRARLIF